MTDRLSWLIVSITTLVLPLFVAVKGYDSFRLPKQLLLEAAGIMLAAISVIAVLLRMTVVREIRWPRSLIAVTTAALFWSALTSVVSTNRVLSIFSLLMAASATMLFVASYGVVAHRPLGVLYLAFIPALINAAFAVIQRLNMWNPFAIAANTGHERTIALLGNSNDVGMFLVAPTVAAAALAVVSKRHRLPATGVAVVLACGLVASETLGAIAALAAGLFVLFFRLQRRIVVTGAAVALLLAVLMVRVSPARWNATQTKLSAAAKGDVDLLLSGRLPAFLAAWRMFRQHPVFGVGLGCFPFHYFDAKIAVEMEHPWLMNRHSENFGEVHNEHLQILAEGGLPAYAIFLSALGVLASTSFRNLTRGGDERTIMARTLGLPLATSIFVLALPSFPLRVAASAENMLFICAVTLAWSNNAPD